eukprot:TRINITY_DN72172_c0_g1_i1.p1 TRINITY_DN72172_c0_g1~~TRINITY_DN72172_c0_g1_i1.p1  ORF type:complete len:204 (-),score=15.26 TRINITY_DN72172_c0_g1_i1:147-758(-)
MTSISQTSALIFVFCGLAIAEAAVVYEVHGGGEPCSGSKQPETLDTSKTCHEFGVGKTHYNSLKVIRCSSQCLCFNQLASVAANPTCDESAAEGTNIKEACFNKCMPDCNGPNCATDPNYAGTPTALKLTGSGDICAQPVSDADYFCDTTGMVGGPAHPSGNGSTPDVPSANGASVFGPTSLTILVGCVMLVATMGTSAAATK